MANFNDKNVCINDYVNTDEDGWLRVTLVTFDGFHSVNSELSEMIHLPFGYITDLKLESEMDYNF